MDQLFETEESRQSYLSEKFDNLIEVIDESYGKALMDELVLRMEKTISDFNDEIASLMEQLKANTDRKSLLLQKLRENSEELKDQPVPEKEVQEQRELSAWERKLENLDKK
ncbi:MAG: DUF4175 domain-containing protein [FCB group bacterium]|nr:DUF4175 domain-containing protein [FCB group bacterium]